MDHDLTPLPRSKRQRIDFSGRYITPSPATATRDDSPPSNNPGDANGAIYSPGYSPGSTMTSPGYGWEGIERFCTPSEITLDEPGGRLDAIDDDVSGTDGSENENGESLVTEICLGMVTRPREPTYNYRSVMLTTQIPAICQTNEMALTSMQSRLCPTAYSHISFADLQITNDEERVKVYMDNGNQLGEIEVPSLIPLLERSLVRAQPVAAYPIQVRKVPKSKHRSPKNTSFEIWLNLYGSQHTAAACGSFLSKNDIYLQHPEFPQPGFLYDNPHLLSARFSITTRCEIQGGLQLQGSMPTEHLVAPTEDDILQVFSRLGTSKDLQEISGDPRITTELLSHQKKALHFFEMRESLSTSIGCSVVRVRGGILADSMGLGKSLSAIALIMSTLDEARKESQCLQAPGRRVQSGTTLIVTPMSTMGNWENEIRKNVTVQHVSPGNLRCITFHGNSRPTDPNTLACYDVIVTTYAVVFAGSKNSNDPLRKLQFFRIILDEAHEIREQKSKRFRAICALSAERKWAMSGTPIQNKLEDLAALFSFIGYEPLGSATAFKQYVLCEQEGLQTGLEKLRAVLGDLCLRRTKDTLDLALPNRYEQLVNLRLGPEEKRLYDDTVRSGGRLSPQSSNPFTWLLRLRMICDHGHDLLPNLSLPQFNTAEDIVCFLCHRGLSANSQSEGFGCPHQMLCLECNESVAITLSAAGALDECTDCSLSKVSSPQQDAELTAVGAQAETIANYRGPSTKVLELIKNINGDTWQYKPDPPKHVVFSVWTRMLDLIEVALLDAQITFCRLDGSMPRRQRDIALRKFSDDPNIRVILMSLQAGGVGINLTSASRVHLMEPHWNPMVELQAIDRVYRIGQRRDVHVRRYVIADTIETSILRLQQKKIRLAKESLGDGRAQTEKWDIRKELIDEIRAEAGR